MTDPAFAMFSLPPARRKTLGFSGMRKLSLGTYSPSPETCYSAVREKYVGETVYLLQQFATGVTLHHLDELLWSTVSSALGRSQPRSRQT